VKLGQDPGELLRKLVGKGANQDQDQNGRCYRRYRGHGLALYFEPAENRLKSLHYWSWMNCHDNLRGSVCREMKDVAFLRPTRSALGETDCLMTRWLEAPGGCVCLPPERADASFGVVLQKMI
jgi:hypothetical protein